jgi:predicted GIY-YIG superfamily endonuclease
MNDCITIHTLVYVLELEGGNWYVGKTHNLNVRLAQHWSGDGAKWTRLFKPIRLVKVSMTETEQEITNEYILLYGKDNVRGGNWTRC